MAENIDLVVATHKDDEAEPTRRTLALALLGALGGTALIEGCGGLGDAESPTPLGQSAQALIGTSSIIWIDSLATDLPLVTGQGVGATKTTTVVVLGYSTRGDGGGGVFEWVKATPPATGDGGTIILPNSQPPSPDGPGYWKRIFTGPLDVRWFGVKGDGVADTGSNFTAFQTAINNVQSRGGGVLYMPPGTYSLDTLHNGQLNITGSNITIQGAGPGATTVSLNGYWGFATQGAVGSPPRYTVFRDFRITSSFRPVDQLRGGASLIALAGTDSLVQNVFVDTCGTTGIAIGRGGAADPAAGKNITVADCKISNCYEHGIYVSGDYITLRNVYVQNPGWFQTGFPNPLGPVNGVKLAYDYSHVTFDGCHVKLEAGFRGNAAFGVDGLLGGVPNAFGPVTFTDCTVHLFDQQQYGFTLSPQGGLVMSCCEVRADSTFTSSYAVTIGGGAAPPFGITINTLRIKGPFVTPIALGGGRDILLSDCVIQDATTSYAIDMQQSANAVIQNCQILGGGPFGITVGTSTGARLLGNRIVAKKKYDLSGNPLSNFFIEEPEPRKVTISNAQVVPVAWDNSVDANGVDAGHPFLDRFRGILELFDQTGYFGTITIGGSNAHLVTVAANPSNLYSSTQGTAQRINVYWDGANFVIQNLTGVASTLTMRLRMQPEFRSWP